MRSFQHSGFTLMELMISITILSVVMMVVATSLDSATKLTDRVTRQTDINNRANDVLNKLAMNLRMASGNPNSLKLPGTTPTGFYTAQNPASASNVKAYYFSASSGLAGSPTWAEQYETNQQMIVYDYSVYPGHLYLIRKNPTNTAVEWSLLLTPEVEANGFSLTRVGNTLQMNLTLRSMTLTQESIIYTAQAQTIFLRSTLNQSSGACAVTFVDAPNDSGAAIPTTTDAAPTVMFGNLVTDLGASQQQISVFLTAPIGQQVYPQATQVYIGGVLVAEGATVTVGTPPVTVTRTTYPPAAEWPSRNGSYSILLSGSITSTVTVTVKGATTAGINTDSTNIPTKIYN